MYEHDQGWLARQSPDNKRLFLSGNGTTDVELYHSQIFVSLASNETHLVRLPNVSEAEGYKFDVLCVSAASDVTFAVVDYTDGTTSTNTTSAISSDILLEFRSIGREWLLRRSSV